MGTLLFLLVLSFMNRSGATTDLEFSDFQQQLADGKVATAKIMEGDQEVVGKLQDGSDYTTTYLAEYADELQAQLDKAGVPNSTDAQRPNQWVSTFITVLLPVILIGGLLFWFMQRTQAGGGRVMQFGAASTRS